jgi:hypothetical protein
MGGYGTAQWASTESQPAIFAFFVSERQKPLFPQALNLFFLVIFRQKKRKAVGAFLNIGGVTNVWLREIILIPR